MKSKTSNGGDGHTQDSPGSHSQQDRAPEIIDSKELARRWAVPESWIREQVRNRSTDPIPHIRLGRYVRYEWASPELERWFSRRRCARRS